VKACGEPAAPASAYPLMRNIRTLDKLIDELAKGKAMGKILREE
jgi:hypothetical protein